MSTPGDTQTIPIAVPKRGMMSRLSTGHVIMIVAGLLAALLNFTLLQQRDEVFQVVVASRALLPGQTVALADFTYADIRASQALLDTLVLSDSVGTLDGQVAVRSIAAGNAVSVEDFSPAAAPLEQRAMSVPVDSDKAVNGSLTINDVVDIILVDDGRASYVALGIEVLAVPAPPEGFASTASYAVTISVDDETALRVASAIDIGELHLVRSTGSRRADIEFFDPAEQDTDQPTDGVETPSTGGG